MAAPQVTINVTYPGLGDTPSYFDVAITASGSTLLPLNVLDGWCVDALTNITPETYTATVYSSYELEGLSALPWQNNPTNLDRINWVLNQNFTSQFASDGANFTYGDIQLALWTLLGNPISAEDYIAVSNYSQIRVDHIINSSVSGIGFIPEPTQYIGLIFDPVDANGIHQQPIFSPILASAMSGFVWQDADVNGLQDTAEVGIDNILVNLGRDLDNDGVIQPNEVLAATITGDNPNTLVVETGYYEFKGLAPGLEYQVQFVKSTGLNFTQPNAGNGLNDSDALPTGDTATVILAPGEFKQNVDAGLYSKATLGNRVWEDVNSNGIQDGGELGISGVTVQLIDANGTISATTLTDSLGNYSFSVTPGTYSVAFTAPSGYIATAANQGVNINLDSNIDASGQTPNTVLVAGQADLSIDAGFYRNASLGNQVWLDANNNGIQDAGEAGVAGVKVTLLDSTGNIVGAPLSTDASGNYLFTGLNPGTYSIQFDKATLPAGYGFSSANQGLDSTIDSDANVLDGKTGLITLISGQFDDNWDAGIVNNFTTVAPVVTISNDVNNDGFINAAESGAATTFAVKIDLPTGASAGDTLTVIDGITPQSYVLTAADIAVGAWLTTVAKPSEGGLVSVSATLTTIAGNTSPAGTDSALLDTTATNAPVVIITTDSNNDGTINASELGGASNITVQTNLPADALVGDSLRVTDGSSSQTYILNASDIMAGFWTTSFAKPAEGSTLTVNATVTDAAGNQSSSGSDSALINSVVNLSAPVVTITTDANNDGFINAAELSARTTVAVQIDLPTGVLAGDTLTVSDGVTPQSYILTADDISTGTWLTTVAKPTEGRSVSVSATLTTIAGNTSPAGTDSALLDTTATNAPVVIITTDSNNDSTINASELGGASNIAVQINLPVNALAGDTLMVTDGIGQQAYMLTASDITEGFWTTSFAKPAEGSTLTVSATVTDAAGNQSTSGRDSALINTVVNVGAPVVTITTDSNNDGFINKTELGSSSKLTVQIKIPNSAIIGDILTITAGNKTINHVVSLWDVLTKTWTTTVAKPAEGTVLTVSASVKSWLTGSVSAIGMDSVLLDTTPTSAPVVTISTDVNNDGKITAAELGSSTSISVQVQLPGSAMVGDKLQVTDGVALQNYSLTTADILAGIITAAFDKPAEGAILDVTATITDAAGNTSSSGSDSALINTASGTLGSIGDQVWEDLNYNGIQDAGENGISGVTVKLLSNSGLLIGTTVTDTNGNYQFNNLTAGSYKLQVVAPSGYFTTKANVGADSSVDSNVDSTGKTGVINLGPDQEDLTWDAGLYRKASIGDRVWEDKNHNGIQDVGEPGIGKIKVMLQDAQGLTIATTTTNSAGNYAFNNLDPGTYRLMFDKSNVYYKSGYSYINLNKWVWGAQNVGTNDNVDSDVVGNGVAFGNTTTTDYTVLQSGQNDMSWDAAITPIAIDLNGDGIQTIARADAQGSFDLLGNGVAIQSGWLSGQDGFLAVDVNGNGNIDDIYELFGGSKGEGFAKLASYDSNGDGLVNASDDDFAKLLVWQDVNGNHQTDAGELISLSDAGISSLTVSYTELPFLDAQQNLHLERSIATLGDGQSVSMTDVYFNVSAVDVAAAGVVLPSISDLMASTPQLDNLLTNSSVVTDISGAMPVFASNNMSYVFDTAAINAINPLDDYTKQLAYVA